MRIIVGLILLGAIIGLATRPKAIPAKWDGQKFVCSQGDLWADESKALAGQDYVLCVR